MSVSSLSSLTLKTGQDEQIVAVNGGQSVPYAQFVKDVRSVAVFYTGKRAAALVCDNSYNFMVGFWGLLHADISVVLPPGKQNVVLESIQDSYDVLVDDAAVNQACQQEGKVDLKPLDSEKESIIFCTSGSTGKPKFVPKSLGVFDKELLIMDRIFDVNSTAVVYSTVPHHHVYGFTFKIAWALAAEHIVTSDTYALWESLFLDLAQDAVLVSSPAHLGRMDGLEPLDHTQAPQLVLSAGAPLSCSAGQDAKSILGCYPFEIFGSTETGAIGTRVQETEGEIWKVLPEVQVNRSDDGHMVLTSPFVPEGMVETSDLIELVDGGFVHKGRGDRIVKIEGKRVSLNAVEAVLKSHNIISDAAVVCLKDPKCLAAAVVLNEEGKTVLKKEGAFRLTRLFKSYALKKNDAESIPRSWRFIDFFPHHAMGKRREIDIINLFREAS